jgi:hypothetical protein
MPDIFPLRVGRYRSRDGRQVNIGYPELSVLND